MKRIPILSRLFALAVLTATSVFGVKAQTERDVQKLTERELSGTAKAMAMGGAVSAVGADAAAVSVNPAGLALFTRNTLSGTFSIGKNNSSSLWGVSKNLTTTQTGKTIGGIDHVFYVMNIGPWLTGYSNRLNFSFSYNREKNFSRSYEQMAENMPVSLADYAARMAVNLKEDDLYAGDKSYSPYNTDMEWFPILAYNAGFIEGKTGRPGLYRNAFVYNGSPAHPAESNLRVTEKGNTDFFDFSTAYSINDYVYLGLGLRTYSTHYRKSTLYYEVFHDNGYYKAHEAEYGIPAKKDYLEVRNELLTSGVGIAGVLGVMVNIGDYGRIALSYLTPQYFVLKDDFSATAASYNWRLDKYVNEKGERVTGQAFVSHDTPNATLEYKLLRPGLLTAGVMIRLGSLGMISYDFDYMNSASARMRIGDTDRLSTNDYLKEQYGATFSHKLGLEIKPTARLALRAGTAIFTNPIKSKTVLNEKPDGLADDLGTSGTMTDLVITKGLNKYFTGGLGFAVTPKFTVDLAYVYNTRALKTYPFTSSEYELDGKLLRYPSKGADTKLTKHLLVMSLNYRF